MFTILRNSFYSEYPKRRRFVQDSEGKAASKLAVHPDQDSHLQFTDLQAALQRLPLDQREALLLVAAEGLSYEAAAEICGVAVGTIKSRTNRARARLATLLAVETDDDVGPDGLIKAAMQADIRRLKPEETWMFKVIQLTGLMVALHSASAIAQTAPAAPGTSGGLDWLWVVLLLVVVVAAILYFRGRRTTRRTTGTVAGVDHDRVAGSARQAKGSVKEGVGRVIGDTKLQAEGRADKAAGKAQNTVGGIKDTLRGE